MFAYKGGAVALAVDPLSFLKNLSLELGSLTSKPQEDTHIFASPALGLRLCTTIPKPTNIDGIELRPHACKASTLLNKLSQQHLRNFGRNWVNKCFRGHLQSILLSFWARGERVSW